MACQGLSVLEYAASFPVDKDAWRPSFSHFSTYDFTLNRCGGGLFTLMKINDDNVSVDTRLRTGVSLIFIHEKPRSHSADEIGRSWTCCSKEDCADPTTLLLCLKFLKSSSAWRLSTWHSLANWVTCLSPNKAHSVSSSGYEEGLNTSVRVVNEKEQERRAPNLWL